MKKNIAIVIPHKGLGDMLFHYNFIKSISIKEKTKIYLFVNKSSKANLLFKNNKYIKKIILVNLRRPTIFLYLLRIFELFYILKKSKINKVYYTGNNKWHIISLRFLKFFYNIHYLFIKQSDDLIINKLNNFLKENRIKNKNNYKFNLPTLSKLSKKKIIRNHINPSVFINIDTSENQIKLTNRYLIKLIEKLKKNFNTIYVNSNPNNEKNILLLKGINIIKTSKYSVKEIFHIIKKSNLFIGTESGPAVIANLLNVKSYIFFNSDIKKESSLIPNRNFRKYYSKLKNEKLFNPKIG